MSPLIGTALDRVDGPLKVTGGARYAADEPVENVAHAALVLSTIATGRVTNLDVAAAEAAPGVLGVLTAGNAPRVPALTAPPAGQHFFPMQDDVIYYAGQPVALVVAESLQAAQRAADLIAVEYAEGPAPIATLQDGLADAMQTETGYYGPPVDITRGDPEQGLAEADVVVEQTYTTPIKHHNPMEPAATIARWEGDHLTLYDATQGISFGQQVTAQAFGLPLEHVRVVNHFVGGGFGCKGNIWPHTILAAMAARLVGRPVKLVLTRAQSYTSHGFQAATQQTWRLGATRDGLLTGIALDALNQTSTFDNWVEFAGGAAEHMYACSNLHVHPRIVRTDTMSPTPTRSPQEALGMIALESAIDELAYALDLDPLELRIRNHAGVDPATGRPWSTNGLLECYRIGAERFGWERRSAVPGSMRDGDQRIGWGMASAYHPQYQFPAAALARLHADGSAVVQSGTQDLGTGTYTVMTQIAADVFGLPPHQVRFELGDTNFPAAGISAGSSTVSSVGPAVHAACLDARAQVVRLAIADPQSPLHGAEESSVTVEDARLFVAGDPTRGETYADVLTRHGLDSVEGRGASQPAAEQPFAIHSFGALFAEVHVDPDLGVIRVSRLVGAYDVGRVVNPKTAASQMIGGIIWGLGQALLEHTDTDRRYGRILNPNLSQYLVPVHADVPDIEIHFVDGFDAQAGPLGTKNIGEVGPSGVPGAIANAVFHATGKRVRDFPITLDKVIE